MTGADSSINIFVSSGVKKGADGIFFVAVAVIVVAAVPAAVVVVVAVVAAMWKK